MVFLIGNSACGSPSDVSEAPHYINVAGRFEAVSYDGEPGPVAWADFHCGADEVVPLVLEEMVFNFLDQNADPESWDNAGFHFLATGQCLSGRRPTLTDSTRMAYRATTDSLFLRYPDNPIVTRRPWVAQGLTFTLVWPLAGRDVDIEFSAAEP